MLVTGSNRSGTTWVGRMLTLAGELAYVHEPFNPGVWPRWTPRPLPYRNLYVCAENEAELLEPMRSVLERRFPWRAQVPECRNPKAAARLAKRSLVAAASRIGRRATLLKDPIAVFSSEWLADRFDLQVVVMLRGPLAFASSIKRLGWAFDFTNWTEQHLLMRDALSEFDEPVRRAAVEPPDLIDQAILTWNATYAHLDRLRGLHPDWLFVDYEALASDPEAGFARLYALLDLALDDRRRAAITRHTRRGNVTDVPAGQKGGIRRDSRAAVDTWRYRLTPAEVERVQVGTQVVADRLAAAPSDAP